MRCTDRVLKSPPPTLETVEIADTDVAEPRPVSGVTYCGWSPCFRLNSAVLPELVSSSVVSHPVRFHSQLEKPFIACVDSRCIPANVIEYDGPGTPFRSVRTSTVPVSPS